MLSFEDSTSLKEFQCALNTIFHKNLSKVSNVLYKSGKDLWESGSTLHGIEPSYSCVLSSYVHDPDPEELSSLYTLLEIEDDTPLSTVYAAIKACLYYPYVNPEDYYGLAHRKAWLLYEDSPDVFALVNAIRPLRAIPWDGSYASYQQGCALHGIVPVPLEIYTTVDPSYFVYWPSPMFSKIHQIQYDKGKYLDLFLSPLEEGEEYEQTIYNYYVSKRNLPSPVPRSIPSVHPLFAAINPELAKACLRDDPLHTIFLYVYNFYPYLVQDPLFLEFSDLIKNIPAYRCDRNLARMVTYCKLLIAHPSSLPPFPEEEDQHCIYLYTSLITKKGGEIVYYSLPALLDYPTVPGSTQAWTSYELQLLNRFRFREKMHIYDKFQLKPYQG